VLKAKLEYDLSMHLKSNNVDEEFKRVVEERILFGE